MAEIDFYGADWCSDCRRSKNLLNTLGVDYEMHDVEINPEDATRAHEIAGRKNIPVIRFADGTHLVEPTDAVLHAELKIRGLVKE
ncbi:MAG: hypothetical protein RL198_166 [Actinomycetota bacterium]